MLNIDECHLTSFKGEVTPLFCGFFIDELIKSIDSAKMSIYSIQYQWKFNPHHRHSKVQHLAGSIGRARKRGVKIDVIFNLEAPGRNLSKINKVTGDILGGMGCGVKHLKIGALVHTKLWIIDNTISFVGSHNISNRALGSNEEVSVKVVGKEVGCLFKQYFERLWVQ